jgi:nucleotide-binding universal stress UspA family protein
LLSKISKILVCVDGSKESIAAVHYSIALAKKYDAQLIALSVIHFPLITDGSFWTAETIKEWREETRSGALKWFNSILEDAKKYGIKLNTRLLESSGPVEHDIVDYAEKDKVDLIIMGTKGRSGLKKMLLGSVALGVVTYAHCPLL